MTAEVFVIFGTAHQPTSVPFPLTLKDYETPLGVVETDKHLSAPWRDATH